MIRRNGFPLLERASQGHPVGEVSRIQQKVISSASLVSGLNPGDVVVQNPTDDLQEGMMVSMRG